MEFEELWKNRGTYSRKREVLEQHGLGYISGMFFVLDWQEIYT